jgi:enamine deaminase RidA (YjgF/YER057c/UK114 family)
VHAQLASDPLYQVQGKARLPPIIIHSPPFSTVYEEVLNVLATAGADLNKVMFTQIALDATNKEQWSQLLSRYPCSICVDTWGYSATFSPTCYPPGTASAEAIPRQFPPDVHLAQSVAMLCHAGHAAQVLLSLAIYCKLQWTSYGGYGYGYLHSRVIPLVRRCLLGNRVDASGIEHGGHDDNMKHSKTSATSTSAEGHSALLTHAAVGASDVEATLSALARDNALRLILWRPPPAQATIEVQRLTCHVCKKLFIPGNHFSKFEFDYCSSGCLSEHRKANWK